MVVTRIDAATLRVLNVEVWLALPEEEGFLFVEGGAERGALYDPKTGTFTAPAPAQVPMPDLTYRQFGEGLWRDGLIGFADYIAFVGPGVIPGDLLKLLDALPDDGDPNSVTPRKIAIGQITGAQTYEFGNPFVEPLRTRQGWTDAYLRERWLAWADL